MTILHCIFQRHGISMGEFYARSPGDRAFMLASMKVQLEVEKNRREGVE